VCDQFSHESFPGWSIKKAIRSSKQPGAAGQERQGGVCTIASIPKPPLPSLTPLLFILLGFFGGLLFLHAFGRFLLGFLLGVFAFAHDCTPLRLKIDADNSRCCCLRDYLKYNPFLDFAQKKGEISVADGQRFEFLRVHQDWW
jgi:hypothetical protein